MANTSEVSYCYRNITNSDRPGNIEIIAPPLFLGLVLLTGLTGLYLHESHKGKKRFRKWIRQMEEDPATDLRPGEADEDVFSNMLNDVDFLCPFDKEVLLSMDSSFNRISELAKILGPSLWAVGLTAAFVAAHDPIFSCIWPYRVKPDINTGVTCFLAPAGLVFALTFGFVFQLVLEKHVAVKDKLVKEMSLLDQMITITTKFQWGNKIQTLVMLKTIKSELITTSMLVQNKEASAFKSPKPVDIRVHIWKILEVLDVASHHKEAGFPLNALLGDKLVSYVLQINNICTDRLGVMHTKIHPMTWAFLEFLGSMSVFGIMIVHASSYRMELTICELTVFSVFMLFYVLADFDSPFNGFFRVDMSILQEVVERARSLYHAAIIDHRMDSLQKMAKDKEQRMK